MAEFHRLSGIPETIGKEWMSLAYIHAICSQAGLNANNWQFDNGIDLNVGSIKPILGIANVSLALQLKATDCWKVENGYIKYDLPVKNYDVLRDESISPQYLVLFTLPPETNNWVKYQYENEHHKHVVEVRHMAYYISLKGKPKTSNKETIRIDIPVKNILTAEVLIGLYRECAEGSLWAINQRKKAK